MLFSIIPKLIALHTDTAYRSPIKLLSLTAEESRHFSADVLTKVKERVVNLMPEEEWNALLQNTSSATWAFHRNVYEHEGLLKFLEEGTFAVEEMNKVAYLSFNPLFVQFISQPFANAFQKAAKEGLKKKDDCETLQNLMSFASFILPVHQTLAFEPIGEHLHYLAKTLDLLTWEGFVRDETVLHFIFSPHWIKVVNALPADFDVQKEAAAQALLQVLKRFRLDASPAYLKAVSARLHQLKTTPELKQELQAYESSFHVQPVQKVATQKAGNRNRNLYVIGGVLAVLVALALVGKLTGPKNEEGNSVMESASNAAAPSASEQLQSSVNEHNLKGFFYLSSRQKNNGQTASLKTGDTPLPGITKLPGTGGNSTLTVKNTTPFDALLFYFGTDNPLVNNSSRLISVYIGSGGEYSFPFQPDYGRFNFLFGKDWVRLNNPAVFPLYNSEEVSATFDKNATPANVWVLKHFFHRVLPAQPFLNHDLIITNIQQQSDSSANTPVVYTLLNAIEKNHRYYESGTADINLVLKDGEIKAEAKSSFYVYSSPKTFDPKELR